MTLSVVFIHRDPLRTLFCLSTAHMLNHNSRIKNVYHAPFSQIKVQVFFIKFIVLAHTERLPVCTSEIYGFCHVNSKRFLNVASTVITFMSVDWEQNSVIFELDNTCRVPSPFFFADEPDFFFSNTWVRMHQPLSKTCFYSFLQDL